MPQTIEITRQQHFERFEENRRFGEMTDIAERLGYPIDTSISYQLRGDAVYALTDTVERPFHNQTLLAKLAGEHTFTGDQSFETTRLGLEHEEALMIDQLAAGNLAGNVLIKFSKIPDAVVEGQTGIKGYRRDLLRSFVRIYSQTLDGVDCRLFTLDHNHQQGIERAGELLGIDATRPSEEVLSDHVLLDVPGDLKDFVDQLVKKSIYTYDQTVSKGTGELTHAGSHYLNHQDAMSAITMQPELLGQHMDAIVVIMQRGLGEEVLEKERQKTAAAIKLATEGHKITSSGDASVTSEVSSGNYDRNCATGSGMNQAASMENIWSYGECQVCFTKTSVGSCKVCKSCARADDLGVDLVKLRELNMSDRQIARTVQHLGSQATKGVEKPKRTKHKLMEAKYGETIEIRTVTAVGSAYQNIVSKRTGKVIDRI